MPLHPKDRAPRLRLSCDGCYDAKVKCSKEKTGCSRCLAVGKECQYSPSSRAGKQKADAHPSRHGQTPAERSTYSPSNPSTPTIVPQQMANVFGQQMHIGNLGHHFAADMHISGHAHFLGMDSSDSTSTQGVSHHARMSYWTLPFNQSMPPYRQLDSLDANQYLVSGHGQWHPAMHQILHSGPSPMSTPRNHAIDLPIMAPSTPMDSHGDFPSKQNHAITLANQHHGVAAQQSTPTLSGMRPVTAGTCTCFKVCLRTLNDLHEKSSRPDRLPAEKLCLLNQLAMRSCSEMLHCQICTSKFDTHEALVLWSVLELVSSLYTSVCDQDRAFFDTAFGDYQAEQQQHTQTWNLEEIVAKGFDELQTLRNKLVEECNKAPIAPKARSLVVNRKDVTTDGQSGNNYEQHGYFDYQPN